MVSGGHLGFGLHSGFFNYVVHFTCLCYFTSQDQGHWGSYLIIPKQILKTDLKLYFIHLIYHSNELHLFCTKTKVKLPLSVEQHITHVNKEICRSIRRVNKRVKCGISRIPCLSCLIWITLVATLIDRCSCVLPEGEAMGDGR